MRFADWLNRVLEMDAVEPKCRLAPEPRTQRPGIVVEWIVYNRQLELYLAFDGAASIIRRDGPADFRPLHDWTAAGALVLDATRDGIYWLENRRPPCPPAQ